jgi:hypothetical protein
MSESRSRRPKAWPSPTAQVIGDSPPQVEAYRGPAPRAVVVRGQALPRAASGGIIDGSG